MEVSEEDLCRLQGRICEPEEVAKAALFLVSGAASFVKGETLFVDNGMLVSTSTAHCAILRSWVCFGA